MAGLSLSSKGKAAASFRSPGVRNVVSGDYGDLANKPSVEGVELVGDKSFEELGLNELSNVEIAEIFNNVMGRR